MRKLRKFIRIFFWQKFRENDGFTKEITEIPSHTLF